MRRAFLSYRRRDSSRETRLLFDDLSRAFGRDHVFRDIDSIPIGVDFRKVIDEEIARADVIIAVVGPRWLCTDDRTGRPYLHNPGDFVRLEIEQTLARGLPLLIALVDGVSTPPDKEDLPEAIRPILSCPVFILELTSGVMPALSEDSVAALIQFVRELPVSSVKLVPVRERYAAAVSAAYWCSLATATAFSVLAGLAISLYENLGATGNRSSFILYGGEIIAIAVTAIAGSAFGWFIQRWVGLIAGLVFLPVALLVSIMIAALLNAIILIPFGTLNSAADLGGAVISIPSVTALFGCLYGARRIARLRAHRSAVRRGAIKILGWQILGYACGMPLSAYLLLQASAHSANGLRFLLISGIACYGALGGFLGAIAGAIVGWRWNQDSEHLRGEIEANLFRPPA